MSGEPEQSCPLIDRVLEEDIGATISEITYRRHYPVPEALTRAISDFFDDYLRGAEAGIEKIRAANLGIREWGQQMERERDEAQEQVYELEAEVRALRDRIEDLERDLDTMTDRYNEARNA